MKPSERRALEAEKRAQKEAEQRERELLKGSSKWDSVDTDDGKPRKESFFQNHVKLITFVICATLILTVLGRGELTDLCQSIANLYLVKR